MRGCRKLVLGIALLLATAGRTEADETAANEAALKSSVVWRTCATYYDHVDALSRRSLHYDIRDASIAFLRQAQAIRAANPTEGFLLLECVNLATGNAEQAGFQIEKDQKEDDQFFKAALDDAINNSNARQYEYMKKLDGKYDVGAQIEAGKTLFKNLTQEASQSAQSAVLMGLLAMQIGMLAYQPRGYGSSGYNFGPAIAAGAFLAVVVAARDTQARSMGVGSSPATPPPITTNLPYTMAPSQANAGQPEQPLPGRLVDVVPFADTPVQTADLTAPHLGPQCVAYSIRAANEPIASVSNKCGVPVQWQWCWLPKGRDKCMPKHLSRVIEPGQTVDVDGPLPEEQSKAFAIVCDMSDRQKFCTR